jgi:flagellar export protein FliJ
MKRFVFRLETLLRHRETLAELREQEFTLAQGRHAKAKIDLDALEAHYRETVSQRPSAAKGVRFDSPGIQSRERYLEAVQLRIAEQAEHVEVARLIAEEMRRQMVVARQAREAVSRLRDKDMAEHIAEQQRKTQESLDEIASVQHARQQQEGTLGVGGRAGTRSAGGGVGTQRENLLDAA